MEMEILERPKLDGEPKEGEAFYCEDWQCPAHGECEHHFGRSYAYAAMICWWDGKDKTPFHTPDRPPYSACKHFRRDKPRDWLKGWCTSLDGKRQCPGCEMPECPNAPTTVVSMQRGAA